MLIIGHIKETAIVIHGGKMKLTGIDLGRIIFRENGKREFILTKQAVKSTSLM